MFPCNPRQTLRFHHQRGFDCRIRVGKTDACPSQTIGHEHLQRVEDPVVRLGQVYRIFCSDDLEVCHTGIPQFVGKCKDLVARNGHPRSLEIARKVCNIIGNIS